MHSREPARRQAENGCLKDKRKGKRAESKESMVREHMIDAQGVLTLHA
jgi:hypothetical protein